MAADLIVARIVHIVSAAIWFGGTLFLAAVAVPYARTLEESERSRLVTELGRRFRPVSWGALIGLLASGIYTMHKFGLLSLGALRSSEYGKGLLVKLGFAGLILVLAAWHDFVLGPRYERTGQGRGALIAIGRTNGILTIVVLVLGVVLAH
jgi:copper transport protein